MVVEPALPDGHQHVSGVGRRLGPTSTATRPRCPSTASWGCRPDGGPDVGRARAERAGRAPLGPGPAAWREVGRRRCRRTRSAPHPGAGRAARSASASTSIGHRRSAASVLRRRRQVRRSWRWQCESNHPTAPAVATGSGLAAGEQRRALLDRQPAGVAAPARRRRAADGRRAARRGRCRRQISARGRRHGRRRPAGPRSAAPRGRCRAPRRPPARARPSTARSPRARRWPRGSAARSPPGPRGARTGPRPSAAAPTASAAAAASGLSGSGAGPTPPHLEPTTVATRGQQVAEVVGQVGVVAGDDALVGEVAVGAERHVAQQVVADGVDPEVGGQRRRGDLGQLDRSPSSVLGRPRASSTSSRRRPAASRGRRRAPAGRCRPPCTSPATTRSGTG